MMDESRITIKKQAEYVMLNSCSVSSSGLYNGKAGMAMALFETARLLDDEYMEEQAFLTLQEALLTQTKDAGFENGLAGIGYVLLSLIHRGLIAADFDELFADRLALIDEYAGKLHEIVVTGGLRTGGMKIILFLDMHHRCTGSTQSLKSRDRLLNAYGEMFKKMLCDFHELKEQVSKIDFLLHLEDYLKIVNECCPDDVPSEVIDRYITGHENGIWMSRFPLAAALYGIAQKTGNPKWETSALKQADIALRAVDVRRETLKGITDILTYRLPLDSSREKRTEARHFLFPEDGQEWEKNLAGAIVQRGMAAGYATGISRLLLCTVNECTEEERIKIW